MSHHETNAPSLLERCFAAAFSAIAAVTTLALWLLVRGNAWGPEQLEVFKEFARWVGLAGAGLGFFGGISLVTRTWSEIWDTSQRPIFSLRSALVILVLVSVGYGIAKHLP